jgi:hypothetical protein
MNEERQRIIERVQKLFALAEQNDSPEEAQLAAMRAQELLQKYDLSLSEVEIKQEGSSLCGEQRLILNRGNIPTWIRFLHSTVSEGFSVAALSGIGSSGAFLIFVGVEPDVTVARQTFEYLYRFVLAYDLRGKSKRQKNEWCMGFVYAVNGRLEGQKEEMDSNPHVTSLVLAKEQITQDYIDHKYKVKTARTRQGVEASRSFHEGVAVGMTTPINRPVEGAENAQE